MTDSVVFYHHSPNLFEEFDMDKGGSLNGSGLWANTQCQRSMHSQSRVEYSFTVDDPNIVVLTKPVPPDQHDALLEVVRNATEPDKELIDAMESAGSGNFVPHDFDGIFTNRCKGALIASGVDATSSSSTVCFITDKNVGDFHLEQPTGQYQKSIEEYMDGLKDKYPSPQKEFESRLQDGMLSKYAGEIQSLVESLITEASVDPENKITEENTEHLKDVFASVFLDQVDGGANPDFNSNRLFLHEVDRTIQDARWNSGTALEAMDFYSDDYMSAAISPPDGTIGKMKDDLRAVLSDAIVESERLEEINKLVESEILPERFESIKGMDGVVAGLQDALRERNETQFDHSVECGSTGVGISEEKAPFQR